MKQLEDQQVQEAPAETETDSQQEQAKRSAGKGYLLLWLLLLLIVIGALGGGGYLGYQQFMRYQSETQNSISELQAQLASRPTRGEVQSSLRPVEEFASKSDGRIKSLQQGQESLLAATENLYELYGRDENGWKLAEVEYLMSVAQHKLLLEQDFEGAAITLDAASNRIAEMADPGLLPVRMKINDEVAALKTRARPDLVGMTLLIARLTRQLATLQPEYVTRQQRRPQPTSSEEAAVDYSDLDWGERARQFVDSLVTIKRKPADTKTPEVTKIIDVQQKLEDNLKLTRWSVLERDSRQYARLMEENLQLFSDYYDLQDAANADFHAALLKLQKSSLKPDFPDISGSLYLLREIRQKRAQQPQAEADNG